jgi:organic radical activating enzyme
VLRVSKQPNGQPEIFYSLQGEGVTMGTPSVFLRLALCNLACSWCDTKYTWDWEQYERGKEVVSLEVRRVEEGIVKYSCRHLVITGGEPLLQQLDLVLLAASLKDRGFYLEVETNGTIGPEPELIRDIDQWNVSPKLHNSGNSKELRELPQMMETYRGLLNAYFKFVVAAPEDVEEVRSLVKRYSLPKERVILMPEGQTPEAVQNRSRWVTQACIEEGFRFSTRLHILLWGDERGR